MIYSRDPPLPSLLAAPPCECYEEESGTTACAGPQRHRAPGAERQFVRGPCLSLVEECANGSCGRGPTSGEGRCAYEPS
eukprot:COSAG01_NODE_534_length_15805_cov_9.468420_13_plen_79_part_00